ncbi:MAG: hypothetical protein RL062_1133 [Bacteroidota bacterium]
MKKVILGLIAVMTLGVVQAQISGYKIGVKLCPNVSYMRSENGDIALSKAPLRLGYGLVVDKMFAEKYAIGTGVNIYKMGGQSQFSYTNTANDTTTINSLTRDYKMTYIEVPLTLKLRTSPIAGMTYWGQFGIGVGYLYKAYGDDVYQKTYQQNGSSSAFAQSTGSVVNDAGNEIQKQLMPVRASMIAAFGVEYPISGSTAIMAGITYNGGLTSIYKPDADVVQLTAGVPTFSTDKKSVQKTSRKISANMIELNVGIIF